MELFQATLLERSLSSADAELNVSGMAMNGAGAYANVPITAALTDGSTAFQNSGIELAIGPKRSAKHASGSAAQPSAS